jgi:outer membrane immunogenic protein
MKNRLLVCATLGAILATSTQAMSADSTVAPATFDWSGFYAGAYVGYTNYNSTILGAGNSFGGLDFGGVIGGNYQMDQFVLGLEGDIGYTGANGTFTAPIAHSQETGLNYALRARAGYAIDTTLLFLEGGAAWTQYKGKAGGASILDDTVIGWQIGAGVEQALTQNITLRFDGLYTNYAVTKNITVAPAGFDSENFTARIGVNYKF